MQDIKVATSGPSRELLAEFTALCEKHGAVGVAVIAKRGTGFAAHVFSGVSGFKVASDEVTGLPKRIVQPELAKGKEVDELLELSKGLLNLKALLETTVVATSQMSEIGMMVAKFSDTELRRLSAYDQDIFEQKYNDFCKECETWTP